MAADQGRLGQEGSPATKTTTFSLRLNFQPCNDFPAGDWMLSYPALPFFVTIPASPSTGTSSGPCPPPVEKIPHRRHLHLNHGFHSRLEPGLWLLRILSHISSPFWVSAYILQ